VRDLESRYRAALRLYPSAWRLENEEAMMGTLLDRAEGERRTTPLPRELANLWIHGIYQRVLSIPSTVPANVRDRASTAALAIGTAIAVTAAAQLESSPGRYVEFFGREYTTFGQFASPAIIVYAVWAIAFFASITGFTTATKWLVVSTIPLTVIARVVADVNGMVLRPTWGFLGLLILLAVVVASGRPASNRRGVLWLVAWFLPAAIVLTVPQILNGGDGHALQEPLWLSRPDVISWSPVIAVSLALAFRLAGKADWATALLLLGIPFTAAAIFGGREIPLDVAWLAVLITGAVITAVVLLRVFGIRVQLERVPPRAPSGLASE